MLNKIFGNKKSNDVAKPAGPKEKQSRALKIIHAGGHTESYYMAIPAARIMEKNPHFVLARPEVFRRPWDSIVLAEDILVPGQKYYLVPRRTVKKLRRRIRKTSVRDKGFCETASDQSKDSISSSISGILVKPGLKVRARNLHVRFFGIETTNQLKPGPAAALLSVKARNGNKEKRSSKEKPDEKSRRARNENAWEPSLHSITE